MENPGKTIEFVIYTLQYQVAWEDDADPERGFKYLYLTPEDYLKLSSLSTTSGDVVRTQLVHEGDENR